MGDGCPRELTSNPRHSEECAAGARTVRTVRGSNSGAACNGYEIRIANALPSAATFRLTVEGGAPVTLAIAAEPGSEGEALTLTAAADETRKVRVSVFGRP